MSREEVGVAEDRKLSAVKSWFSRSVSFGGLNGSSTALSVAAACKGLSEGNNASANALPDQSEAWGGLGVNLKPLSMRRVKTSSEGERESPSMVPRNVTPLTPLTPLRWKSNPRDEEEEEPEEETKLVQEPKAVEQRSRLGLTVTNAEEHLPAADVSEDEQDVGTDSQGKPFEGAATESPSGQDMKIASGDDVMTMTIDFLRARLLSERSTSKAAKQQIQELGMKVTKLELELEHEVEKKKKAEKSAEEALLKLLTGNFSRVADCTAKSIQHVNSGSGISAGEEIKEELQESGVSDFSRTDSIGSSLGSKDSGDSKKKDSRAAIENRLRKMWSQMSADMNALAEDGSQGEQLMSWMEKVPTVLQNSAGPQKSALEEMQLNSVNDGQQKKAIYQQGRSTKAHESESREYWHEKQLQQEYPPSSYRKRDAEGSAYGVAPTSRSAEDAFRHDLGDAHPMWDDRDGLDQTSTDSYYRQIERDEPHRRYRHGHRRSRSADSSNWPGEEDYKLVDVPHQQRLSGEVYPGRRTHSRFDNREGRHESSNGMTRHNAKTNGSAQRKPPPNEPVQAPEPKLFLGHGPAFDAPKDRVPSPPYQQGRVSNSNITDVLLALRKAKASIQKSGSDRAPSVHPHRASWEPVKSKYSVDSQTQYHTLGMEHDMGAARMRPSNSSPSLNYNLRHAANGHSNYVDQLNVGSGIEFFF